MFLQHKCKLHSFDFILISAFFGGELLDNYSRSSGQSPGEAIIALRIFDWDAV